MATLPEWNTLAASAASTSASLKTCSKWAGSPAPPDATRGTAQWLSGHGVPSESVAKVYEGRPNIVDRLKNDEIALVMNTTEGTQSISDSLDIRRVALMDKIPYFTTAAASIAVVAAMKARGEGYGVRTLQG